MSPFGLLYAVVFNGALVTVAVLTCFDSTSSGRTGLMPAILASLIATFFLERIVPNVDPRVLSLRSAAFAISYPLGVAVLAVFFTLAGYLIPSGGSLGLVTLVSALVVVPLIVGVSSLAECWATALGSGLVAAMAMVMFKRLCPTTEEADIPAPPHP